MNRLCEGDFIVCMDDNDFAGNRYGEPLVNGAIYRVSEAQFTTRLDYSPIPVRVKLPNRSLWDSFKRFTEISMVLTVTDGGSSHERHSCNC